MIADSTINLISKVYSIDSIGSREETETIKSVFAQVNSINQNEWFRAGNLGLKPSYKITMYSFEYSGEEEVEYNNVRYGVYRTYQINQDLIELYLEQKAGV